MGQDDDIEVELARESKLQKLRRYSHQMLGTITRSTVDMGPDDIEDIEDHIRICAGIAVEPDEYKLISETRIRSALVTRLLQNSFGQTRPINADINIECKTYEERLTYWDKKFLMALKISS